MSLVWDAVKSRLKDRPFNLEFAVTRQCNSKCKMCNQWKLQTENELSLLEIKRIFESYQDFRVVGVTGGEPTLRKDLIEILEVISFTQPKLKTLFLTTNGYLPIKLGSCVRHFLNFLDLFISKPQLHVLVSVDGDREIHNRIRGVPTAYDNAVESLKVLSKLKENYNFVLSTVTSYSPYNCFEYDKVLEEIRSLKTKFDVDPAFCLCWHGNLYHKKKGALGRKYLDQIKVDAPKIVDFLKDSSPIAKARSFFWRLAENIVEDPHKQVLSCQGGRIRYFMDSLGKVYPCVVWSKPILDLRKTGYDFECAFYNIRRKIIRELIKKNQCPICYVSCEFIPTMMSQPIKLLWKLL